MRDDEDDSSFLGGRVAGAVVVAAGTYEVLWYRDTWELGQEIRVGIAALLGLLFLAFGRNVWRWIDRVEFWSYRREHPELTALEWSRSPG